MVGTFGQLYSVDFYGKRLLFCLVVVVVMMVMGVVTGVIQGHESIQGRKQRGSVTTSTSEAFSPSQPHNWQAFLSAPWSGFYIRVGEGEQSKQPPEISLIMSGWISAPTTQVAMFTFPGRHQWIQFCQPLLVIQR